MLEYDDKNMPSVINNKPVAAVSGMVSTRSTSSSNRDSFMSSASTDSEHSTFASAIEPRIQVLDTALQSLDSLNEQILQFIFSTSLASSQTRYGDSKSIPIKQAFEDDLLLPQQRDALRASLSLMRRLLMDAQVKFKKMVDDNRQLATHIDSTIQSANQEVNSLRIELDATNQKLKELTMRDICRHCQDTREIHKLMEENKKLATEHRQMQKENDNLRQQVKTVSELSKAKDELEDDRMRLRKEKQLLLQQLEELQTSFDDKEEQLRNFIREHEQQMENIRNDMSNLRENNRKMNQEKGDLDHRHHELGEVVASFRNELVGKDKRIREMEADISMMRQSISPSQIHSAKRSSLYMTMETFSIKHSSHKAINNSNESHLTASSQDHLLSSPSSPCSFTANIPCSSSSNEDVHTLSVPGNGHLPSDRIYRKSKLSHLSGSLSRAFGRQKTRKSIDASTPDVFLSSSRTSLCVLSEDEKKEILEETRNVPMHKWKADSVLVWLELVMHMPQYISECAENIKSGKVLLGMTDDELESGLGVTKPLHRRKLSLAIDEFQNPSITIGNMSSCGQLDHWWVSENWLLDIGLSQYASVFRENLVDGRVLSSITRKDLEKYLGMEGQKMHQDSLLRGIQLLQMLGFDRQRLDDRRQMCQSSDSDVVVWSNSRLAQWAKGVDLKEYAQNLKDTGVNGSLLALEPSFTSDDLATALGIPPSKSILRRHLATEFDALVKPARESIQEEQHTLGKQISSTSLSKAFLRATADSSRRSRRSLRSISRTFGRQFTRDHDREYK